MTGLRIPRQPSADDIRAAELAMLPGLIAEVRQPVVQHRPRYLGLIAAIQACTYDQRREAA